MSETVLSKKDLKWQCRRGMLELDLLFNGYLENTYDELNVKQKELFTTFLACTDPELFAWLMDQEAVPTEFIDLVHDIKKHA
jgi:antitoxin CptB